MTSESSKLDPTASPAPTPASQLAGEVVLGRQELPADLKNELKLDRAQVLADELNLNRGQVARTLELLDGGATIPFIARYRKERTGGLDDT